MASREAKFSPFHNCLPSHISSECSVSYVVFSLIVNRGAKYYFVGSYKTYFFITSICQFILSFVALKITIVNMITNKAVYSCFAMELCKLEKNNVYVNSYVEENYMWFCIT